MAKLTGTLKVEIRESIKLNDNSFDSYNSHTIRNITDVSKRIVTVLGTTLDVNNDPVTSYKGQEILAMGSTIGSGTFVEENVRYIRITNLSNQHPLLLTFKNEDDKEFLYKLDKEATFIYSGETHIPAISSGSGVQNSFDTSGVPTGTSTPPLANTDSMGDLVNILAMASSSAANIVSGSAGSGSGEVQCNVELFVATI